MYLKKKQQEIAAKWALGDRDTDSSNRAWTWRADPLNSTRLYRIVAAGARNAQAV